VQQERTRKKRQRMAKREEAEKKKQRLKLQLRMDPKRIPMTSKAVRQDDTTSKQEGKRT